MGGKKHTPLSYAKVALEKARPRRGSVADDVLAVVKKLEDETSRLIEDNARLEERIRLLAPLKPTAAGAKVQAQMEKKMGALKSEVDEVAHWQREKERLHAQIEEWQVGFRQINQREPDESDRKEIAQTTEALARAQRGEDEALTRLLEASGERVPHPGEWQKQQFRWTCCGNRDARSRYCCACGREWHMEPKWKVACKDASEIVTAPTVRQKAQRARVRNSIAATGVDMLGFAGALNGDDGGVLIVEDLDGNGSAALAQRSTRKHKRSSSVPAYVKPAAKQSKAPPGGLAAVTEC
eukprot:g616.t1